MATFRNDTGDDLTLDRFGLYVPAGCTFEIPDVDADSLAGQPALVRVASDAAPDVVIPAEIARDLEQDVEPEQEPGDVDEPPTGTPKPEQEPVETEHGVTTGEDETPAPDEAPVLEQHDVDDDTDLDTFTQA